MAQEDRLYSVLGAMASRTPKQLLIRIRQITPFMYRGGNVNQNTSNLLNNAGSEGNYWSSTAANSTNSYNLNFNGTSNINPSNNNNRQNGRSVRCLYCARSPFLSHQMTNINF